MASTRLQVDKIYFPHFEEMDAEENMEIVSPNRLTPIELARYLREVAGEIHNKYGLMPYLARGLKDIAADIERSRWWFKF